MLSRFRIVNTTGIGKDTEIFFVDEKGKETRISAALQVVKISAELTDLSRAEVTFEGFAELQMDFLPEGMTILTAEEK